MLDPYGALELGGPHTKYPKSSNPLPDMRLAQMSTVFAYSRIEIPLHLLLGSKVACILARVCMKLEGWIGI